MNTAEKLEQSAEQKMLDLYQVTLPDGQVIQTRRTREAPIAVIAFGRPAVEGQEQDEQGLHYTLWRWTSDEKSIKGQTREASTCTPEVKTAIAITDITHIGSVSAKVPKTGGRTRKPKHLVEVKETPDEQAVIEQPEVEQPEFDNPSADQGHTFRTRKLAQDAARALGISLSHCKKVVDGDGWMIEE